MDKYRCWIGIASLMASRTPVVEELRWSGFSFIGYLSLVWVWSVSYRSFCLNGVCYAYTNRVIIESIKIPYYPRREYYINERLTTVCNQGAKSLLLIRVELSSTGGINSPSLIIHLKCQALTGSCGSTGVNLFLAPESSIRFAVQESCFVVGLPVASCPVVVSAVYFPFSC